MEEVNLKKISKIFYQKKKQNLSSKKNLPKKEFEKISTKKIVAKQV